MSDQTNQPELVIATGTMIGEYEVEQMLGEGGFGRVYRAVHPVIGKAVAIKVLGREYSSRPEIVSRFVSEARAVNQIRNRHIVDIFAFGELSDGRQYFVMELLEGATLDQYLDAKGRLPIQEALPVLQGVARALDAAHAAGIAHRDLKPENIVITSDERGVLPKLLDFGIAKLMGNTAKGYKTQTGVPIGTPYYMSPEQCEGKNVDHRTDIYSLGVVTHEILTGKRPFVGDSFMVVMMKHMTHEPPRMSESLAEVQKELDEPVLHMMAKKAEDRPASAGEAFDSLLQAAKRAGHTLIVPSLPPLTPRVGIGMTPAELEKIGAAPTVAEGSTGTGSSLSTEAGPRSGLRSASGLSWLWLLAGAFFITGVVAVWWVKPWTSSPQRGDLTVAETSATIGAASATPSAASPPESAAAPVVSVAPPVASVEFTVQSVPDLVDVYLGDDKLGSTPAPIAVKKGDDKIKLTFRAKGFKPSDLEVTPSANGVLSIKLVPTRRGTKPVGTKKGHKELEF